MNEHQQIAYANPCREAEETGNSRFHWGIVTHGRILSALLTLNVGLE